MASMRPFHQHCLEWERTQLARVNFITRRYTRKENILSLRVDEVFVHIPLAVRQRFIAEIEGITYDMVHTILPPGRKAKYQKANSSTAPVYRVKLVDEAAFPGGTLALRKEEVVTDSNNLQWTTHEEPLEGPDGREQIVERAVAGRSFCVLGAAGTAKV